MPHASRLSQLRQQLADFRKVSTLPYWRIAFAEFLLTRAEESLAVGRVPEAQGLMDRMAHWLQLNQPRRLDQAKPAIKESNASRYTVLIQANLDRLRETLIRKKHLVPAPERESFQQGLLRVERKLGDQKYSEARQELDSVRTQLIRRLQRSYRARAKATPLVREADGSIRNWVRPERNHLLPVGPYNNQQTLGDVCQLVGERDPIWIEDFVELYSNLLGYVERLGDPEKNARKPVR